MDGMAPSVFRRTSSLPLEDRGGEERWSSKRRREGPCLRGERGECLSLRRDEVELALSLRSG